MATEPENTSSCYTPCASYVAPVGRLPVLGKVRAEIDKLRASMADDISQIRNRDKATEDNTEKAAAEIGLLKQKTITELSQTSDVLPTDYALNTDPAVVGVIGKQKNLFQKQSDGFDRDAEQKLAKILADSWAVRQTTDGADSLEAGLDNAAIKDVIVKAKTGIGVAAS